ncbi:MAG TPA: molybdate ABC transporter substrate-binding protein [Bacillus bacterium]|nr:molybdate ABC transporter substrate-binding protein [Bacillus sp. (in: firmicutes)]
MAKRVLLSFLAFLFVIALSVGCSRNNALEPNVENSKEEKPAKQSIELTISAAASLTDALNEMKQTYENEHKSVHLLFNFNGSGKLALQIEQGAPVDVFLSADQKRMDELEDKSLILADSRQDFTGNKLVLIGSKDKDYGIASFTEINPSSLSHIAVGDPESVPVGTYTKEIITKLGKWDEIESKVVLAKDVRQVLTYVESGNADIGFVYLSDALTSDKVKVLAEADASLHTPIIYPAAVTADSKHQEEAKQFIEFLQSDAGQNILERHGFVK